jgi:hypothetical protein
MSTQARAIKPKIRPLGFGVALLALVLPLTANAGKLEGNKVKPDMKYKVTVCHRPDAPKVKGKTLADYNAAKLAYDTYAQALQGFADCVEREARADLQTLQEAVFNGGQEAIAHSQRDIDAVKAELDALAAKIQDQ